VAGHVSFRRVLSLIGFALVCASAAAAPSVVTLTASAEPAAVPPGGALVVNVTLAVDAGWHVYGLHAEGGPVATSIALASGEGFEIAGRPPSQSRRRSTTRASRSSCRFMRDARRFACLCARARASRRAAMSCPSRSGTRPATTPRAFDPCASKSTSRSRSIPVPLHSMSRCRRRQCRARPHRQPPAGNERGRADPRAPGGVLDHGLLAFLLTAGLFGFASLLTPCVFPISRSPCRSSPSAASADRAARHRGARLRGSHRRDIHPPRADPRCHVGCVRARQLAANPWLNLSLGALFIALALSLFGVFEIRMPGLLLNWAGRGQQRGGHIGVMFMGLAFTLTSFTCTVAFAGFLLGQAAQGNWLWPGLGMLVFSSCFALPFFLLALFPQWLRSLPSSATGST